MAGTGAAFAPPTSFEQHSKSYEPVIELDLVTRRNAAMPVAQPAKSEAAAAVRSDSERLVDQLADRIGGLGVELADVAGNLQEVAGRVSSQSARFGGRQKAAAA